MERPKVCTTTDTSSPLRPQRPTTVIVFLLEGTIVGGSEHCHCEDTIPSSSGDGTGPERGRRGV